MEEMRAGKLLLLSNTGQTKEKFLNNNILLPELESNEIRYSLLRLIEIAESDEFSQVSHTIQNFYREIAAKEEYIQSLLPIYAKS